MGSIRTRPPQTRSHQTDPHMPKLWIVHWFKSRPLRWHILHYFATTAHGEGWDPSEPDPPKLEPTKQTTHAQTMDSTLV